MKIAQATISLFTIVLAASAVGCAEDVDSEAVRTEGMWVDMDAVSEDGEETHFDVRIRVGGSNGTFVELTGDDRLVATGVTDDDDSTVVLDHDSSGDRHWYNGTIPFADEGAEMNVDFQRGDGNTSAPDSTVSMPAPFEMDIEADSVERGQEFTVTWDNTFGDSMNYEISGDCIDTVDGQTDDDMEFVVPGDALEVDLLDEGESCQVTVELSRVLDGDLDPAFGEGGSIQGIQRRTATFRSDPAPGETDDGMGGSS